MSRRVLKVVPSVNYRSAATDTISDRITELLPNKVE